MKNTLGAALFLITSVLWSCHTDKSINTTAASESLYAAAAGDYQGYLRCAGCANNRMWYNLQLKKDGSFMLRRQKAPDEHANKSIMGSWTMTSDSLVYLPRDSAATDTFFFDGNTLRLKFGESDAYKAAGTDFLKRIAPNRKPTGAVNSVKNPDFTAMGEEWTLKIDLKNALEFNSSKNNISFAAPVSEGTVPAGLKAIVYRAMSGKENLVVTVFDTACERQNSDSTNLSSVSIAFNNGESVQEFRGCGKFLPDQQLSKTRWVLQSINNNTVDTTAFMKGAPVLVFNTDEAAVGGNNGCNSFSGTAERRGDAIWFGDLAATLMQCPDMEQSDIILKALTNQRVQYVVSNDELRLTSPTGDTLIYVNPH